MRRALWEMSDNQIAALLDRAIMVLDELYVKLGIQEDLSRILLHKRNACKPKSVSWHRLDNQLFAALKDLASIEQRVQAQETIVTSFRNEMSSRNPPFWTRYDLDRINRQR